MLFTLWRVTILFFQFFLQMSKTQFMYTNQQMHNEHHQPVKCFFPWLVSYFIIKLTLHPVLVTRWPLTRAVCVWIVLLLKLTAETWIGWLSHLRSAVVTCAGTWLWCGGELTWRLVWAIMWNAVLTQWIFRFQSARVCCLLPVLWDTAPLWHLVFGAFWRLDGILCEFQSRSTDGTGMLSGFKVTVKQNKDISADSKILLN